MTTVLSEPLEFKDLLKKNQASTKELTKEYDGNYFLLFIYLVFF